MAASGWLAGLVRDSRAFETDLPRIQGLIARGDLAKAQEELVAGLRVAPKDARLLDLLGVVQAQEGKYREAESSFRRAIAQDPRLAGAYLNLGQLYQVNAPHDADALRKAAEAYGQLLRFDPNNIEARYQSAVILWRLGSFSASLQHLARLSAGDQEKPQALALACADYAALNEPGRADAAASKLLASPGLTETDVTTILPSLEAHKQVDLEVRLLEGLAERRLAGANSLRQLGLLYQRQGRLVNARESLEKAATAGGVSEPLVA